jgi:16S rRNA (cytosine1402-N4)-methyltransferase
MGKDEHTQSGDITKPFEREGIDSPLLTEDDDNCIEQNFATLYHTPVMWRECIDGLLNCERGRIRKQVHGKDDTNTSLSETHALVFVDGTLGGGGHSAALLASLLPRDIVFGCDVDPKALATASERLRDYMGHDGSDRPLFVPVQTNFGDMATILPTIPHPIHGGCLVEEEIFGVDGVLLDLGVSSHQIDEPDRGFSFMRDGPLDMRMSASVGGNTETTTTETSIGTLNSGLTAADICNEFDERELQRIFSVYGDEPRARTIAKAVVQHRPLSTTGDLVQAIGTVIPAFAKSKRKGLTATCARIFQSLRIVVNNEDGVLERVLSEVCPSLLRPGGRLVVMSYHSMEDRATKRIMRDGSLDPTRRRFTDDKDLYGNYMGPAKPFKPVGKMQKASEVETARNSRSRSAVLRIAERQDNGEGK